MKDAVDAVRAFLIWVVALPVFGTCLLLILALSLFHRGRRLDGLMKVSCRLTLLCCGVRVRLRGGENMAPRRQYIVMMNHVNFLDPLVFCAHFPGIARGVEEESHFRWPLYGLVLRRIGMIPISRKDTTRAKESLRRAADLVRANPQYSLAILPEGTRTPDGKLGPFKRGGFHLAVETGLDILPFVQVGSYHINRKGSLRIRPGRIVIVIAPPVAVLGVASDSLGGLMERVRSVFLGQLGEQV